MNIGIDARLYHETGVGRYIYNLLCEYSKIDDKNHYTVFTTQKASSEIVKLKNMTVVPVSIQWHSIKEQLVFPFILNRYRFDLIHFPYFSVPIFNTHPFIVTIHDLTTLEFKTGRASTLPFPLYYLKHLGYTVILKNALFNSKKIIVPSHTVKDEVIKHFPSTAKKIEVTFEAGSFILPTSNEKLPIEPFFLYVGNVYPHKNIENAIRGVSQLNKQLKKKYSFVIVSKKDHFRNLIQNYVNKNNYNSFVIFKENLPDRELGRLYKRAEALVFPSFKEGFGLPILEAFQNKCIVACSDIPVFKELYGDIPFYFDPHQESQIGMTLQSIINMDSKKKKLLKEKGLVHSKKFDWQKTAKQTLEVYSKATI